MYLIFVLNCITRIDENYASHCSELSQLHQQPFDAVLRPTFIWKLIFLPNFIKINPYNFELQLFKVCMYSSWHVTCVLVLCLGENEFTILDRIWMKNGQMVKWSPESSFTSVGFSIMFYSWFERTDPCL